MAASMIGLTILVCGKFLYDSFCERVSGPDDRETPAYARQDGVDYVPMPTWKNALVNLLNIAGTGLIPGPIQGVLFGPVALITIPTGNMVDDVVHDYPTGMIRTRGDGIQMPGMVKRYMGETVFWIYDVFICVLLLPAGTVFIYTSSDITATQIFGFSGDATDPKAWIIYGVISAYYYIATAFPIDKAVGRIYPIFGAILVFSTIGVFGAMLIFRYPVLDVQDSWNTSAFAYGDYFFSRREMVAFGHFVSIFFVTVTYDVFSGFHSAQTALVTRILESEREGGMTFYNMMIVGGFIAMVQVAGTMALVQIGTANEGLTMKFGGGTLKYFQQLSDGSMKAIPASPVVGVLCHKALGPVDGAIVLAGIIVSPVASGDTALRTLCLTIVDTFYIKQDNNARRLVFVASIFTLMPGILVWSKVGANGSNQLWKYFARSNQAMTVFVLTAAVIYLLVENKRVYVWMPLVSGVFYAIVYGSYILNARIDLNLPRNAAYIGSILLVVLYTVAIFVRDKRSVDTL